MSGFALRLSKCRSDDNVQSDSSFRNTADVMNQLVWRREANSTNVIVGNAGHLVSSPIFTIKRIYDILILLG